MIGLDIRFVFFWVSICFDYDYNIFEVILWLIGRNSFKIYRLDERLFFFFLYGKILMI